MSKQLPLPAIEYEIQVSSSTIHIECRGRPFLDCINDRELLVIEVAAVLEDVKTTLVDKAYRNMTH